jgi:acyl carrier protein
MTRPQLEVEALVDIFRRVLDSDEIDSDEIGSESDFFASGGDSLLATRVISAVARNCGVELTFDDLLLAPTPDSLAKAIAALAQQDA